MKCKNKVKRNKVRRKIWAGIYRRTYDGLRSLLLRNNPVDPRHGGDFWYVVTGAVEKGESLGQAVEREAPEETGICKIINIVDLGYDFRYPSVGDDSITCVERAFWVEVVPEEEKIRLNEEKIDHIWLNKDEFFNKIYWFGDKSVLRDFLNKIN